ncbi:hypothetical protein Tco_1578675 [Tanacetum coccineum]
MRDLVRWYTAGLLLFKKRVLRTTILVPKPPRDCAGGKKFKEDLFTYYVEDKFFEDLQDTSESSDDNTNIVNAPQEPFVGRFIKSSVEELVNPNDDDSTLRLGYRVVECIISDVEIVRFEVVEIVDRKSALIMRSSSENSYIMSLPNLECFKFKIEPDPGDLTSIDLGIRKNVSTTNVNVPLEDDQSSLFAYVVWIFLAFLTYPVVPPYLLSTRNEDTIFDPGISI